MPKQDITIRQLVDKVKSGELRLPEMQRKYVWTAVKVRDLLDSLYREYPSGTILVWETDQQIDDRTLQVQNVANNQFSSKLLLLDGQQRLTSLTAILSGDHVTVRKRRPIDVYFNLEHPDNVWDDQTIDNDDDDDDDDDLEEDESEIMEELKKRTFVVASRNLANDPLWISVTKIFQQSDSQLLRPLNINSDDPKWDKYSERINQVRRIQDYSYVMHILDKKMSYEEVTEIFVRVNSLGVKLRGSDLALAQITSRWKGFLKELEAFADEFGDNAEYLHNSGIMIKAMVAFATNQSRFKTVGRVPLDDFKKAWENAKAGLRFAINFLHANVQIANLNLISSPFLLIPVAYFAVKKNEKLTDEEVKKLQLWFYAAHMKGRYSYGSSESYLDSDLSVINRTSNINELLSLLKLQVKDFFVSEEELAGKSRRSPYFSMVFFIAKQKGVKDWFTKIGISERSAGKAHALQFHHIFPKSLLKAKGLSTQEINDIANLAFINGKTNRVISNNLPKDYLVQIKKDQGDSSLLSQHIPLDTTLWQLDNYLTFLSGRRTALTNEINDFIRKLT